MVASIIAIRVATWFNEQNENVKELAIKLMRARAFYQQKMERCETDECREGFQSKIDLIDETLHPYGIDLTDGFTLDDWDEVVEALPEIYKEGLEEIVGEIGDLSLDFIRGLGAAIVEGLDGAYAVIVERLKGKEPEVIATITATIFVVLVASFLWHEVKRGPRA